jgi:ribosomal protein S18 acetylase RimI-like enzyme
MKPRAPLFRPRSFALPSGVLRPLQSGEAAALSARLTVMDPWRTLGFQTDKMALYLNEPDPALHRFAVEIDDALAGVVAVRHPWLRGAFLELLAVLPPFQRRGVGADILHWLETHAFARTANVWVTVSAFNDPARAFYRQHGYAEIAVLPDLVTDGFDEVLLRKTRLARMAPARK